MAWISERKDVLSTLFGLLGLLAYVRYARQPNWSRLALVLLAQVASLMSKPMLVTFPFLLLLLDYWPLQRWPGQQGGLPTGNGQATPAAFAPTGPRRLLLEKVPLLLASAGSCVITVLFQSQSSSVASLDDMPIGLRLANAVDATFCYLEQTFYPLHLALFYPYPNGGLPWWRVLLAGLLLAGITAVVCWQARSRPYLLVGWLWYLGTLVPVIGIVQVGSQPRADRYTYVPLIGVFVMLAWGLPDLFPKRLGLLTALTAGVLLICLLLTRAQVRYWETDLWLWEHAVTVTADNPRARIAYGSALLREGDIEGARLQMLEARRLKPHSPFAHYFLGKIHEARRSGSQPSNSIARRTSCSRATVASEPLCWSCPTEEKNSRPGSRKRRRNHCSPARSQPPDCEAPPRPLPQPPPRSGEGEQPLTRRRSRRGTGQTPCVVDARWSGAS